MVTSTALTIIAIQISNLYIYVYIYIQYIPYQKLAQTTHTQHDQRGNGGFIKV